VFLRFVLLPHLSPLFQNLLTFPLSPKLPNFLYAIKAVRLVLALKEDLGSQMSPHECGYPLTKNFCLKDSPISPLPFLLTSPPPLVRLCPLLLSRFSFMVKFATTPTRSHRWLWWRFATFLNSHAELFVVLDGDPLLPNEYVSPFLQKVCVLQVGSPLDTLCMLRPIFAILLIISPIWTHHLTRCKFCSFPPDRPPTFRPKLFQFFLVLLPSP